MGDRVNSTSGIININPSEDGKSHLNIYSKSRTSIGKKLSNIATIPLSHPIYGNFISMEGYWYWLSTGMTHSEFRLMDGWTAKGHGRNIDRKFYPDFQTEIVHGLNCKFHSNESLLDEFMDIGDIPLTHYHNYSGSIVDVYDRFSFIPMELDRIRKHGLISNDIISKWYVNKYKR